MQTPGFTKTLLFFLLIPATFVTSCEQNNTENKHEINQNDLSSLKKEIELRLRDYENYLRNGDSIALGNMYVQDAEIIPSTAGRENITKVFGEMIRDSIIGSFETTNLWGTDQLLVEEGKGSWSKINGKVIGRGKYLLVWKKDDKKWKILRDTWFPEK